MSKILILHSLGLSYSLESLHVPRIGERIARFCVPYPTVKEVVNFPSDSDIDELLKAYEISSKFEKYDVIIFCG